MIEGGWAFEILLFEGNIWNSQNSQDKNSYNSSNQTAQHVRIYAVKKSSVEIKLRLAP